MLGILHFIGLCVIGFGAAQYNPVDYRNDNSIGHSTSSEKKKLHGTGEEYWRKLDADIIRDKWLYLLLLPGLIYFIVFKYLPMFGIVIAFENYVPYSGVLGSEWVGLKWFQYFFKFPAWVLYVPHFISIVIVVSITFVMFGPSGIVYKATEMVLGHPINYMGSPDTFRWMIIGQTVWKETGWGTIIFLAALTNVDTQLYEAAMVDGAGRLRRLWHITLPAIRSTIVLMLILRMGSVLDTGYDHLILMANPLNRKASQTLDVFVYQQGIQSGQFSYASAIGLMKSIVSVTLVVSSNKIAHLLGEQGLY